MSEETIKQQIKNMIDTTDIQYLEFIYGLLKASQEG